MDANGGARAVLVHDWLTGMRGGEKCLEVLCRRWPRANSTPSCTGAAPCRRPSNGCGRGPASSTACPAFTTITDGSCRSCRPPPPACRCRRATWSSASATARPRASASRARRPRLLLLHADAYTWHMRDSYFGRASFPNGILGTNRLLNGVLERLRRLEFVSIRTLPRTLKSTNLQVVCRVRFMLSPAKFTNHDTELQGQGCRAFVSPSKSGTGSICSFHRRK